MVPTVSIFASKKKIALVLTGCLVFVVADYVLWMKSLHAPPDEAIRLRIGAVAGWILFGGGGLLYARKLLTSRPLLVIDSRGITDKSSYVAAGLVPWTDILGFHVAYVVGWRFLVVDVKNPEDYIRCYRGLKKKIVSRNTKMVGSPVSISTGWLWIDFDDLLQTLKDRHAAYQHQTKG